MARQRIAQRLQTMITGDGKTLLGILEHHVCNQSRVCIHIIPATLVPVCGSGVLADIIIAWLQYSYILYIYWF